jgi:uncharacterized Tic20 family protein
VDKHGSRFVRGFFKTAYKFGKPFLYYIIVNFVIIGIAESLHHIPGLAAVNSFGFENFGLQLALFAIGALVYVVLTFAAFKRSCEDFEKIDL